jgi:hypothetical protein
MGGISRVHGTLISPKNFAGVALSDFTLSVSTGTGYPLGALAVADTTTADGALDAIFRKASGTVGTVSRVGTLSTSSVSFSLRFAVETLGADADSPSYLGGGVFSNDPANLTASTATAAALTVAVRALGTVNGINLSTATVAAFTY